MAAVSKPVGEGFLVLDVYDTQTRSHCCKPIIPYPQTGEHDRHHANPMARKSSGSARNPRGKK
jgi:hypothetical protein